MFFPKCCSIYSALLKTFIIRQFPVCLPSEHSTNTLASAERTLVRLKLNLTDSKIHLVRRMIRRRIVWNHLHVIRNLYSRKILHDIIIMINLVWTIWKRCFHPQRGPTKGKLIPQIKVVYSLNTCNSAPPEYMKYEAESSRLGQQAASFTTTCLLWQMKAGREASKRTRPSVRPSALCGGLHEAHQLARSAWERDSVSSDGHRSRWCNRPCNKLHTGSIGQNYLDTFFHYIARSMQEGFEHTLQICI